jgi:two-component system, sensor histidine kinase
MNHSGSEAAPVPPAPGPPPAADSPQASLYKPKDLATTWKLLAVTTFGNTLIAGFFVPYLPLWMPLTWLAIALSTGGAQLWCATRPVLQSIPYPLRLYVERAIFWFSQAGMGSAAFLLYVPGDMGMLGVLNVCVVVIGAMSVLQFSGDHWRGSVGCALAILPTATRYFFESSWLLFLLGLGGYVVVAALSMFGRVQYQALLEQAALRKRAEEAADALAAMGMTQARFFAAVSHDLRQPVHAIGLYLASLQAGAFEGAAKRGVEGIGQAWRALDGLLSQVLDLTRVDTGSLKAELGAVELEPLIRGLVVQHSAAAEKKSIRVVALVAPGRYVLADTLMLNRVLSNLLDNAIKFSPEDARVVIALRSAGMDWSVQVRDSGLGIAKAMHDKVFEEFVQLDNPQRDRAHGLGLGLSIAHRFVALMQGRLHLRSASGAGTCISVLLAKAAPGINALAPFRPAGAQPAPLVDLPVVAGSLRLAVQASGKSLLIVEDDALVERAITQLLRSLGLPVLHAPDAAVAMSLAPHACMAACDVRLPGPVSGMDLAVWLQQAGIPALLMTGETAADVKAAARANDLPLFTKPVAPQALLDGLAALVGRMGSNQGGTSLAAGSD